jgi:hypothetical protein
MFNPEERTAIVEKQVYETPDIVYQAPLEVMASECAPAGGGKADASCTSAYS